MPYLCPKCHVDTTEPSDVERMRCSSCGVLAADLRDELISELADPDLPPLTRRDCCSAALATLCLHWLNTEARLVHGFLRDSWTGELVAHAWVEQAAVGTRPNCGTNLAQWIQTWDSRVPHSCPHCGTSLYKPWLEGSS